MVGDPRAQGAEPAGMACIICFIPLPLFAAYWSDSTGSPPGVHCPWYVDRGERRTLLKHSVFLDQLILLIHMQQNIPDGERLQFL